MTGTRCALCILPSNAQDSGSFRLRRVTIAKTYESGQVMEEMASALLTLMPLR